MKQDTLPPFELIEAFLAAGRSRTFLEAATRLNISQASLSQRLKEFEKFMALPIFSYQGRKKILTVYGQTIFKSLEPHFSSATRSLLQINQQYRDESSLELRVAGRGEVCATFIQGLPFRGSYKVIGCPATKAYRMLADRDVEVALGYEKMDSTEIISKKIFTSTCQLIVSKKLLGSASKAQWISKENLEKMPFLSYRIDGPIFKSLQTYLGKNIELKPRVECDDWLALVGLVESGMGYSVVPHYISVGQNIESLSIPETFFPKLQFYAFFSRDLMKLPPFARAIRGYNS